jgi:hypothetical protein
MQFFRGIIKAGRTPRTQDKIIKNKGYENFIEMQHFDPIPEKLYDVILAYFIDQEENKI